MGPVKVRSVLVTMLLAGVALVTVAVPAAGQPTGPVPRRETEAERIARETIAAVRASEQGGLTTSLAPLTPAQRQRLAVEGPLAGRWTTCQLPEGFNPVHASVLPDGTVLLMAGSGNNTADFAAGRLQSYLFSADTCAATRAAHARRPVLRRPRRAAQRERPDRRRHQAVRPLSRGCAPATSTTG